MDASNCSSYSFARPKGQPGDSPVEAALREVEEETGYRAELVAKIAGAFAGTTGLNEYWLMRPLDEPGDFDRSETQSIKWVMPDDARLYIRKTTNTKGRNRDLDVLNAALKLIQHREGAPPAGERPHMDDRATRQDRFRGALLGLAVGDALGTSLEFRSPGSFEPIFDMVGGGPFHLKPGQWTDDTSMALCLAESLIERGEFDAKDQMERYVRWYRQGHLSSTGRCFDIGNTVRQALTTFERSGEPFSGSTDPQSAGNGSLMRLAPVVMFFLRRPKEAIEMAAKSSLTTHGATTAVDACRYFAALLLGAFAGVPKEKLLSPRYCVVPDYWAQHPIAAEIDAVAVGSYKAKHPPQIRGTGYVVQSLEAALWAFYQSENFRDGCLLAANLGEDADTTAAVYGQLAGAYYGLSGVPPEWVTTLALREKIEAASDALFRTSAQ